MKLKLHKNATKHNPYTVYEPFATVKNLQECLEKEVMTANKETRYKTDWIDSLNWGFFPFLSQDYKTLFISMRYWKDRTAVFKDLLAELGKEERK